LGSGLGAPVERAPSLPLAVVLIGARIAKAGLRLDVVEPDVLGAGPVRPHLLAGNRAGVAADALVQVHDHRHLSTHSHQNSTSPWRLRMTVISSRCDPVGP